MIPAARPGRMPRHSEDGKEATDSETLRVWTP
jgi:hypothetical protein